MPLGAAGLVILRERDRSSERLVRLLGGRSAPQQPAPCQQGRRSGGNPLQQRLREIAAAVQRTPLGMTGIRWGRRLAYRLLRRQGWTLNHKPVQQNWRSKACNALHSQEAKAGTSARRVGRASSGRESPPGVGGGHPVRRQRRGREGQVSEHDRCTQPLCLAIRVGRRSKARNVVAVLEPLTNLDQAPTWIQSKHGPEFNCFAEAQGLRTGSRGLL
jgi:hypothetical protein